MLSLFFYALLGIVLGACDITVMSKTLEFFSIMLVVVAIDVNSKFNT